MYCYFSLPTFLNHSQTNLLLNYWPLYSFDSNNIHWWFKKNSRLITIMAWIQVLPATILNFLFRSKKYIPVQRGYGRRNQRQITIHDGLPSLAEPWFQYLSENNLMVGDEVVFFYRFDEHTWEVLFRKEVIWDEDLFSWRPCSHSMTFFFVLIWFIFSLMLSLKYLRVSNNFFGFTLNI